MKTRTASILATLALAAFASGCATTRPAGTDEVRIVPPAALPQGGYTLVHRIWIENWHVPFYVPWFDTQEEAVAALQAQAAMRGADALTNVSCIPVTAWYRSLQYFCHGDAVKLKPATERPFFATPSI